MISLAALFLLCALLLGLPIAHGFTFRQKIVSHQSSAPRTSPFVAASSKTTYSHKFHHDNVLTLYMSDASLDNGASPSMTSSSLTTQLNTAATTQEENLTADSFLQDDLLLIENAKTSTWNWGINILRKDEVKNVNEIVNTSIVVLLSVIILAKLAMVDVGMTRGWTSEELAARMAIDNWDGYLHVLRSSPIATKAVTSATVYTIGDIMAQRTEGASMGDLDRPRILRSMLAGFIGHGPLSHFWYEISENFFDHVAHLTQWWSFIPKVIVDQSIWGPIWNNTYIILLGLMKMESFETIFADMKRTTIPLIVSGLKLWPLAHCITYGLIPVENRLLWVDMVEILWVTILSAQAAGTAEKEPGEVTSNNEVINDPTCAELVNVVESSDNTVSTIRSA